MKTWMRFGIGVAALAMAVAVGTGAYAMRGTDDAPAQRASDASEDGDAPLGGGGGIAAACIEGSTDCNDTPGIVYEDSGDTSAKCAADATDCAEPAACLPDGCTAEFAQNCVMLETDPPITECYDIHCGELPAPDIEPGIEPAVEPIDPGLVDPPTDGDVPVARDLPLILPVPDEVEGGFVGSGCLGIDPCTISSRQVVECLPPDCAVSSDGGMFCPLPPCVIEAPAPGETEIKPLPAEMPCAISPCLGNDPFAGVPESCPSPPCTVYSDDVPLGMPCEPCAFSEPAIGAPDGVIEECAPATDPGTGSGGGSSGSSGGSGGSTPVEPVPDSTE